MRRVLALVGGRAQPDVLLRVRCNLALDLGYLHPFVVAGVLVEESLRSRPTFAPTRAIFVRGLLLAGAVARCWRGRSGTRGRRRADAEGQNKASHPAPAIVDFCMSRREFERFLDVPQWALCPSRPTKPVSSVWRSQASAKATQIRGKPVSIHDGWVQGERSA